VTRDLRSYSCCCTFSSFMSISHLKCPLDVQLDISVRQIEGFNGQNDISVRNHLTFVPTVFPAQVTAGW
jgi:hypothetical protein